MNTFLALFAVTLVVGMQACVRMPKPEASCGFVQNSEKQRVSWAGRLPVKLKLHSSVPREAYDAIDRVVAEYNASLGHGREIFRIVERGVAGPLEPNKDGVSMVYWFTSSWDPAKPNEQARTTIFWDGTHLFDADVRVNAYKFNFNFTDQTDFHNLDLESLLDHEFGHVLGLADNQMAGSVMNKYLNNGEPRRKLGAVDLSSLSCEY